MEILLGIIGGLAAFAGALYVAHQKGAAGATKRAELERAARDAAVAADRARLEAELATHRRLLEEQAAAAKARIQKTTEDRLAAPVTPESADQLHADIDEELEKP